MRHAVFVRSGKVEWREAPDPRLQSPKEALVRPLIVGRCDLDVVFLRGMLPIAAGEPIGHEVIAEIVDLGEDAGDFHVGQKVFVPAQISCGDCAACRRGMTGRCLSVPFGASYGMGREGNFGGALADFVRVPFARAMLTPVPHASNPAHLIGAADMATDAWRAVAPHLARHPGGRVLILGGLPAVIGLYAAGLARALKAPVVDYIDGSAERLSIARSYGARALSALPDSEYDVIVVANADKSALEMAFSRTAPGGVVTSVAPTLDGAPSFDTRTLYHRGVTWHIGRPDCRHAHDGTLSAWANCGFRPDLVPTQYVDWDDAPEAWSSDALYVAAQRRSAIEA